MDNTESAQVNDVLQKAIITIKAITESHSDYIQDLSFEHLSHMYENILNAYLKITDSTAGAIVIFNSLENNLRLVTAVYSNTLLSDEINNYFEKIEENEKNLTRFQSLLERVIHTQNEVKEALSAIDKAEKNIYGNNFWGIPLIRKNKLLGVVCLFDASYTTNKLLDLFLNALHQASMIITVGYKGEERNKEALKLMKIKDEMLDLYLSRLEHQNLELAHAKEIADLANKAKSTFITNLGHEFRTPLQTIIGMTELLLLSDLNTKQIKYSKAINSSAELILELINNLLDIAKIESGEFKLEAISLDLSKIIREVANLFSLKAIQKEIEFIIYYDPKLPSLIKGDPIRIRQVLTNLLGNAFKFTHQGHIILSVILKDQNDQTSILFEVADTGIGIPESAREKIFQKFSQVDASISRKFGGTGLGLSISKQFIEMMHGRVGYKSLENMGSTFWFELPLLESSIKKEIPDEKQMEQLKDISVLVASSHEMTRNILSFYLQNYKVIVKTCKNLIQLLETLKEKEHSYRFVIIDNKLLNFKSDDTWPQILQLLTTLNSKIILLAAEAEAFEGKFNKDLSFFILSKPFLQRDLINIMVTNIT